LMKRHIVLVLVALQAVAVLYAVDSTTFSDCDFSFELGKQDARQVSTLKWFFASWGVTFAIGMAGFLYEMNSDDFEEGSTPVAIAQMAGIGFMLALPLFISSQPKSPSTDTNIGVDCYNKGYSRKLKGKRFLFSLGGVAVGCATLQVAFYAMAFAAFIMEPPF
jgi:hypothetical protein